MRINQIQKEKEAKKAIQKNFENKEDNLHKSGKSEFRNHTCGKGVKKVKKCKFYVN